jgi:hypothetical protein
LFSLLFYFLFLVWTVTLSRVGADRSARRTRPCCRWQRCYHMSRSSCCSANSAHPLHTPRTPLMVRSALA